METITWPANFSCFFSFLQLSWTVAGSGLWWEFSVECFLTSGQKDPCLVVSLLAMERKFTLPASVSKSSNWVEEKKRGKLLKEVVFSIFKGEENMPAKLSDHWYSASKTKLRHVNLSGVSFLPLYKAVWVITAKSAWSLNWLETRFHF